MVATCYLLGVAPNGWTSWVQFLGITGPPNSQVSVMMAADFDAHVADFRSRPVDAGRTRSWLLMR